MRKLSGMLLIVLMALLLAACGSDDEEESEPTVEATQPEVSTEVAEETEVATEIAAAGQATPESIAGGLASPMATPAAIASPAAVASPVAASPVASPVSATPESGAAVVAAPAGDPPAGTVALTGAVTLPGAENETYVVSDDGCVGIGEFSDVQAGRQVVVRNEAGSIIGVTTLEASETADSCTWQFALEVPASAFYSVSIPMVVEHVFTSDDVRQNDGEISITLM